MPNWYWSIIGNLQQMLYLLQPRFSHSNNPYKGVGLSENSSDTVNFILIPIYVDVTTTLSYLVFLLQQFAKLLHNFSACKMTSSQNLVATLPDTQTQTFFLTSLGNVQRSFLALDPCPSFFSSNHACPLRLIRMSLFVPGVLCFLSTHKKSAWLGSAKQKFLAKHFFGSALYVQKKHPKKCLGKQKKCLGI